jgi:hypothetical protein
LTGKLGMQLRGQEVQYDEGLLIRRRDSQGDAAQFYGQWMGGESTSGKDSRHLFASGEVEDKRVSVEERECDVMSAHELMEQGIHSTTQDAWSWWH